MDLCYVTERIIALWVPLGVGRAAYRRGQQQAAHMLHTKHGDNYMVFNLSEPRRAARSHHGRVHELGWSADLAPPLERLCSVCKDIDSWLSGGAHRIAVLHARGSKDRIGVVVAAYMHYSSICGSADQALDRYAMARFLEDKVGDLEHPSHKRYVEYFSGLLSGSIRINSAPLYLTHVTVLGAPSFEASGGCHAFIKVYEGLVPVYTSGVYAVSGDTRQFTVNVAAERGRRGLQLRGDVLLKCYHREYAPPEDEVDLGVSVGGGGGQGVYAYAHRSGSSASAYSRSRSSGPSSPPPHRPRQLVFACQFHTCAVADYTLSFTRQELDNACNDLRFPLDGAVELHFSPTPEVRQPSPAPTPAVPVDTSDDPVTRWDSYENISLLESPLDGDTDDDDAEVNHTFGPLDGSLYATISKKQQQQQQQAQLQQAQLQQASAAASPGSMTASAGAGGSPGGGAGATAGGGAGGATGGAGGTAVIGSPHTVSMDSGISSAGNGLHGGGSGAVGGAAGGGAKASPAPPATPLSPEEHHRALDELLNDMLLTVENIPDLPAPSAAPHQQRYRSHVVTLDELPPPPHFQERSQEHHRSGVSTSACWQYPSPARGAPLQPPPPSLPSATTAAAAAVPPPPPASGDVSGARPAPPPSLPTASPPAAFSSQSLNGYLPTQPPQPQPLQPLPPPAQPLDALEVHRYIDEGATTSSSEAAGDETNIPYHARQDSRPFTYGAIPSGPGMLQMHTGLASPSLVRKASFRGGSAGAGAGAGGSPSSAAATPATPPSPAGGGARQSPLAKASPPPPADFGDLPDDRRSPSRADYRFSNGSSSTSPRSPEFHDGTVVGAGGAGGLTWLQRQQQKLRERREGQLRQERRPQEVRLLSELRSLQHHQPPTSPPNAYHQQTQQQLNHGYNQHQHHYHHHSHSASHRADGYTSDTTHFADDDDAEEDFSTPLHINTSSSPTHKLASAGSAPASPLLPHRTSSRRIYTTTEQRQQASYITNGGSPGGRQKDSPPERERPFVAVKRAHEQARKYGETQPLGLSLNHHEAPSHITSATHQTSSSPDSSMLLTMVDGQRPASRSVVGTGLPHDPLGNLMATLAATSSRNTNNSSTAWHSQMREESFSSWRTASVSDEPGSPTRSGSPRPQTPAFPVHPRTPYVNSSTQQFDISQSSSTTTTGLPPKSPTTQRKDRSPSPVSDPSPVQQHQNTSMISNSSSGASSSRTMAYPTTPHSSTSLSDVYLQQSPKSPGVLNGSTGQSSPTVYYGHSRRSSVHSNSEPPQEVSPAHVKFVRDTSRFWYKPTISREEAINMLREQPPGTFVVRDSNSFPGAFGLALKVATPPPNVQGKIANINDPGSELVRHFLIEPTSRGVRLKGCANEPVFSSLSALVYQHSLMPMALPCRLLLPESDGSRLPADSPGSVSTAQLLLAQGAACNVLYLFTLDTESLTGPQAIKKAVAQLFMLRPLPQATVVHFKVSGQGITLTDNKRQLFFRRHYPVNTISFCGLDPDDHRWSQKSEETGMPISSNRVFGFVARKPASKTDNQCHIFAELEPEQPASAIVNFVSKVMMSGGTMKANIV
ncbi:hypothetical protein R5R35_014617 [Gryllus longicercus]|uniref:Tensin n=1 Tax=Gryllus longicercus TaxID=2509291 RepID=A0AAN9Z6Z3_9ORTH